MANYTSLLGTPSGIQVRPSNISGYKQALIPQMTPQQSQILQMLLGALGPGAEKGLGFLSQLGAGEEEAFQQFEGPQRQMYEKNIEDLANRFSGFGAQGSSAFQNILGGQGREYAENIASQRGALRTGAIESLLSNATQLLGQQPYQQALIQKAPRQQSGFGQFLGQAGGMGIGLLGKKLLGL